MKDVILIPTYNESKNIPEIIEMVFKAVPKCFVIVIDDNSPDGTAEIASNLIPKYPNLSVYRRKTKNGLGEAYKELFKILAPDADVRSVITMDADGSHNPKYIPVMLKNIENYDLIIGSRYVSGGGVSNWVIWRRALSYFGNLYTRILLGLNIRDITSGFICIRRELLQKINLDKISAGGYAYQMEFKKICSNLTSKILEIPILFEERREGESKISSNIIFEGLIIPIKIFFRF